jgi:hypothetical protein
MNSPEDVVTQALSDLMLAVTNKQNATQSTTIIGVLTALEQHALDAASSAAITFIQLRIARLQTEEHIQ